MGVGAESLPARIIEFTCIEPGPRKRWARYCGTSGLAQVMDSLNVPIQYCILMGTGARVKYIQRGKKIPPSLASRVPVVYSCVPV